MSIDKIKKNKEWGFNLTPANYSPADKTKDKRLYFRSEIIIRY